jgi:hypothetical protein
MGFIEEVAQLLAERVNPFLALADSAEWSEYCEMLAC